MITSLPAAKESRWGISDAERDQAAEHLVDDLMSESERAFALAFFVSIASTTTSSPRIGNL
ncbi:MAG: hypothetical protein CBB71_12295 [Rhodopirellula sp. TMED11]|nr:MAG: hypothetical protein CBB71_12295 [Rhodopirellula sp. TMED11]